MLIFKGWLKNQHIKDSWDELDKKILLADFPGVLYEGLQY